MNKATRLKILGFLVIPFQVFIVVFFFLYPYLKPDKYQEIVEVNQSEYGIPITATDSTFTPEDSLSIASFSQHLPDSLNISSMAYLTSDNGQLHMKLDSLLTALNTMELERNKALEELEMIQNGGSSSEDFLDRVKSLFNLEPDELAPILDKMTSKQLVRLYKEGSSMQREKMLRSLNSEKAAKLLTEIML